MPKTYSILQKDNDQLGTDIWRDKDITIPMAYRPILTHMSRANATGTNLNQTIESSVPVVRLVDGLAVSTDAFKATFKFSALQHVVETAQREQCFDALMTYLIANRRAIVDGTKPLSIADWDVTFPA